MGDGVEIALLEKFSGPLALTLGVEDPRSIGCWLRRLFFLPASASTVVALPSLPDAPLPRYTVLWLARELGVRDVSDWREWLLRLCVPPPAAGSPPAIPTPTAMPSVPRHRLLPALHRAMAAVLERITPPRWLADFWEQLAAELVAHPVIGPWLARFAPERAVPLLEKGLAWVRRIEDEALLLASLACLGLLAGAATTPLDAGGQALFAVAILAAGSYLGRMRGEFAPAALAMLSLLAMLRYAWWRADATLDLDFDHGADFAAGVVLAATELVVAQRLLACYFRRLTGRRKPDGDTPALVLPVLLAAPNLYLLGGIRLYAAPALAVALYAVPYLLLALMAMARLHEQGWAGWAHGLAAGWQLPFPLALAALNLAGLLAALTRVLLTPDAADVPLYAIWACANLWVLKAGGRLRPGHAHAARMQGA